MIRVQPMRKGISSVADDPWATRGYPLTDGFGFGQNFIPTMAIGFLMDLNNFRGHRFRIAKPANLCPLPS
jgi:hypothetical protein